MVELFVLSAVAARLAVADPNTGHAEPADRTFRVRIERSADAVAVQRAVAGASRRLEQAECRKVFADFRDASGNTLQDALEALGQTGESYLDWISFYDGFARASCAKRGVFAVTTPGSRVIWICGPQFREQQLREPAVAEAVIIHEVLHSLGLRENPPTSAEITRRVILRCGSSSLALGGR